MLADGASLSLALDLQFECTIEIIRPNGLFDKNKDTVYPALHPAHARPRWEGGGHERSWAVEGVTNTKPT